MSPEPDQERRSVVADDVFCPAAAAWSERGVSVFMRGASGELLVRERQEDAFGEIRSLGVAVARIEGSREPHLRHPAKARSSGCPRADGTLTPTLWPAGTAASTGRPFSLREVLMRWVPIAAAVLVLTSCGGNEPSTWRDLGGICAAPRPGVDRQGTLDDEKKFLRAWTDDLYLWYSEVPASDPASFPTAIAYFDVLKTPVMIGSKPKDRFHFTYDTAAWASLSMCP